MKALTTLWTRLTEPHASIRDEGQRHRAQLLSATLLLTSSMVFVSTLIVSAMLFLSGSDLSVRVSILGAFFFGILLLDYRLSRTRHILFSAQILAGAFLVGTFVAIIAIPDYQLTFALLPFSVLVGSAFLSRRTTIILFVAATLGVLLLPAFGIAAKPTYVVSSLAVVTIFGVVILVIVGTREDFSRQVERQARILAREERRFRSLFEQMNDAVFVLDLEGNHLAANRRAADMLGYSLEELLRLSFREISVYPEESEAVREKLLRGDHIPLFERVFRRKNGEHFPVEINTELVRDEQGSPLHIQSVVRDITRRKLAEAALQQRLDELSALYATTSDLIQLRDLQDQLQFIVERATKLLNTTSGGLYLCEPERQQVRCVVSYNTPRDYTGTTLRYGEGAAGKVAQTGEPLIVDDYRTWSGRAAAYEEEKPFIALLSVPMIWDKQVIGALHALHATQSAYFTESHLTLLTAFAQQASLAVVNARLIQSLKEERAKAQAGLLANEQRAVEMSEVLVSLAALDFGKYAQVHGTDDVFDALAVGVNILGEELKVRVSDLATAKEAAEAASRAKSDFISAMNHELRTPLNSILGFAQLLEMDADELPPKVAKTTQQITAGGNKLLGMINKILDFANSDTGKLELVLETLDVSSVTQDLVARLEPAAMKKRIQLTFSLPPAPCHVHADVRRLYQIVQTLIENAIAFTPEEGKINVVCSKMGVQSTEQRCLITVTDSGIGMNVEQLARLFQPLTQMDSTFTRTHGGLGLDLALAQKLAELHGGRIRAESAGENKGSTFYLEIPMES